MIKMPFRFQEQVDSETARCIICPRMCTLKPGQQGFCGTKENQLGKIVNLTYGIISTMAVDPIEKKPLAHFYPGSRAFSISSVGCSFTCPWCQNWHISTAKSPTEILQHWPPEHMVDTAHIQECTSIAYTYNEPLINLDYLEDCARLAHKENVKNVLVTNGYVSMKALDKVADVLDAANVDWKGFNEEFYRKHCSGDLQSILDSTVEMQRKGVHVEITFLIIPETNDDPVETRKMAKYIVENMGPDVPLHLSRFHPDYKFNHLPPTPVETLIRSRKIALEEGIRYVFLGNVHGETYEDTVCPECNKHVVRRSGYVIIGWHLDKEMKCLNCGYQIPIIGQKESHSDFG